MWPSAYGGINKISPKQTLTYIREQMLRQNNHCINRGLSKSLFVSQAMSWKVPKLSKLILSPPPPPFTDDRAEEESSYAQATMKYFWQQRHRLQSEPRWPQPKSPHSSDSSQSLASCARRPRRDGNLGRLRGVRWGDGSEGVLPVSSHFMTSDHTKVARWCVSRVDGNQAAMGPQ